MRTVIVIMLVLCGALGWWATSIESAALPPSLVEAHPSDQIAAAAAKDAAATVADASVDREDAGVPIDAVASQGPAIPEDAKWYDVCIVDRASGDPVVGADVWWANMTQWELVNKLPQSDRLPFYDIERRAKEFGWHTRSDEQGLVRVSLRDDQVEVIAEKDGHYGTGSFGGGPQPREGYRIELELDVSLRVQVWSAQHKPARGVPIAITEHDPSVPSNGDSWWWGRDHVDTNADGIAVLRHLQFRQRRMVNGLEQPVPNWKIHVRSPGLEVDPVVVDAQVVPSEPVVVQLPDSGHLRVRMLSQGKPWREQQVMVYPSPDDASDPRAGYMWMAKGISRTPDQNGWLENRHVGLGQMFRVGTWNWSVPVAGPTQDGEVATATVNLDEHVIMVVGRLLRQGGEPLAGVEVMMRLHDGQNETHRASIATKEDGSFQQVLQPGKDGAALDRMRFTFEWNPKEGEGQRVELAARVLHVGLTDLGDVRMQAANLIVKGQIVPSCDKKSSCHLRLERLRELRRPNDKPRWDGVHEVEVQVAEDMSFSAYGTLEAGRYRLSVYSAGFVYREPVEFALGAQDLRIDMTCGNQLQVRCLLPEPLTGSHIQASLLAATVDAKPRQGNSRAQEPGEADYSWQGLSDGSYTLELRIEGAGSKQPLHRIEGIQLPLPGSDDGVYPDIDLRGQLAVLQLQVSLSDNRQDGVTVFLMPQEEEVWRGMQVQPGISMLPVPIGVSGLLVAASGFEPVTLQAVSGSAEVTLRARPICEIHVIGLESLSSEHSAYVSAKPLLDQAKDPRRYRAGWGGGSLSSLLSDTDTSNQLADGRTKLRLGDGVYELHLQIAHRKTRRSKSLSQLTPNQITSSGSYQVQVSPQELQQALAEMAKPPEAKNK